MARDMVGHVPASQAADAAAPVVAHTDDSRLRVHLRELRGGRSLSEAAELIGLRGDELGRIERGETKQIRFSTLLRILTAFDCSPDTLLEVERDDGGRGGRYAVAMDAFLAGSLPAPGTRRGRVRPASDDEQDMADAIAFVEPIEPRRSTRGGAGTLNP